MAKDTIGQVASIVLLLGAGAIGINGIWQYDLVGQIISMVGAGLATVVYGAFLGSAAYVAYKEYM